MPSGRNGANQAWQRRPFSLFELQTKLINSKLIKFSFQFLQKIVSRLRRPAMRLRKSFDSDLLRQDNRSALEFLDFSSVDQKFKQGEGNMKKQPTVAVVIPYFNGSKFIARSLASALNQSMPANEIIIVNDGSRATEREFLHQLTREHSFKIIDKPNGGQGSARNAGVAASTANYICFLDQDDFFLPEHIEILLQAIPANDRQFGFAYADLKIADGNGDILFTNFVESHSRQNPKTSLIDLLQNDMFVLPSASIICRNAFDAVSGFDEQFTGYEDDDLFLRLFRKGYTNHFVNKAVTVWCIHAESTSYSIKMCRSRFRYFKKLAATFNDDADRNLFIFRDCLMPRFGSAFIRDAVKAVLGNTEHRLEVCEILRTFSAMVSRNSSVGRRRKAKLKLLALLLTHSPRWLLRTLKDARRVALFRRLTTW